MQYPLLLTLVALFAGSVRAQITITEADLRTYAARAYSENTFSSTDPGRFAPLTLLRGGPHTFNFTGSPFTPQSPTTFTPTTCAPTLPGCDDPRLSAAAFVQRIQSPDFPGVATQFLDLDANSYRIRGGASRGDFDPNTPGEESFSYVSTPASVVLAFPVQMGRTWTSSYQFEITYNGTRQPAESITDVSDVLAYGTLVTPAGSDQALMVRERSISTSTFAGVSQTDTTFSYTFITRGPLQASLFTDARGTILSADYTVLSLTTGTERAPALAAGLALDAPTPNPAATTTRLAFSIDAPRSVRLSVHDLLGREVALLAHGAYGAGRHEVLLNAARLAPGAYVVRLVSDGAARTQMLSVAH